MRHEFAVHLIQWRNLNLDPELYIQTLGGPEALLDAGEALGLPALLAELKGQFPQLRYGYFNPAWGFEDQLPRLRQEALQAARDWQAAEGGDKLGTC